MIVPRDEYLEKLKRKMWNGAIKVITGVRRCGKSFFLNVLFRNYLLESGVKQENIISIDLDSYSNRKYRNIDCLHEKIQSLIVEGEECYIFIDEIQFVKGFEDLLNEYLHNSKLDVYVTGSNSRFLSRDVITEFRGRGDEVRIHPLSFSEYMCARGGDCRKALNEYMVFGGMPKLISIENDNDKRDYLDNLFKEIYLRDMVERYGLKDDADLGNVTDVLCSSIGTLVNPLKISDTLKMVEKSSISKNTVVKYIEHLSDSFLFEEVRRYDIKGRKYIGALYKYYCEDIGLRNARLNFRQQENTHIMENIIYNELRIRGYNVDIGIIRKRAVLDGVSVTKEYEVDFVVNMAPKRYYIQSVLSIDDAKKEKKEKTPLASIGDSFKKIIVVMSDIPYSIDDSGIMTVGIYDFLLDKDILDK